MAPEEAQKCIEKMRKDFEARYVVYLGYAMLQYQHRVRSGPVQLWVSVSLHIPNK